MFWVIQSNIFSEEGHAKLIDALDRLGIEHALVKCIPFSGLIEPDVYPPAGPVIVMGSYTLARVAQFRGWKPGSFINENLDFREQHARWGKSMLNADSIVCSIKDVPPQRHPFFVRPVHDTKSFTGMVTDWPTFAKWQVDLSALTPEDAATVDPDTLVQVCSKKEIWSETRTWIVDGRVVTASGYKIGTIKRYNEVVDERIIDFANKHATKWSPLRAYVLDVADTPQGLKIVEINNINSAGFYRGDMVKLVMALEDAFNEKDR